MNLIFSGEFLFANVFKTEDYLDVLKKTLDKDQFWQSVGEAVFENDPNKNELHSGWLQLKDIKNKVKITIEAFDNVINVLGTSVPAQVTWLTFKTCMKKTSGICTLETLDINDTTMVCNLTRDEILMVARKLALLDPDWWKHCIDKWVSNDRRDEVKTTIEHKLLQIMSTDTSGTNKLKNLIIQKKPWYTLEEFYNACKKYGYNETLKDLRIISIKVLEEDPVA